MKHDGRWTGERWMMDDQGRWLNDIGYMMDDGRMVAWWIDGGGWRMDDE